MKIELSRSDPLSGEADILTLERANNRANLRIKIKYKDQSGATITIRKQDLLDALKAI